MPHRGIQILGRDEISENLVRDLGPEGPGPDTMEREGTQSGGGGVKSKNQSLGMKNPTTNIRRKSEKSAPTPGIRVKAESAQGKKRNLILAKGVKRRQKTVNVLNSGKSDLQRTGEQCCLGNARRRKTISVSRGGRSTLRMGIYCPENESIAAQKGCQK